MTIEQQSSEGNVTTYYKATRPDGTDFYTGRVLYEVGKRVRPLPFSGEREICGPGYLHAADVPAETLVGGTWPCRLFEVVGKPAAGFDDDEHPHKGGFRQLVVIRELEAWRALGPNGREVAELIDRAGRLTADEVRRLDAARDAARDAAGNAARVAAWNAARDAAGNAARVAAWNAARDAARDAAWAAAWVAARVAARDATLALVVRDLITEEQFDLLYGPWWEVVG